MAVATGYRVRVCSAVLGAVLSAAVVAAQERRTPRVVGLDENAWPIFAGGSDDPAAAEGPAAPAADEAQPAPPTAPAPPGAAAVEPDTGAADVGAAPVAGASSPPRDALGDVFRSVGRPDRFAELGGVRVTWTLRVLDAARGVELGRRTMEHVADLGHPRRDRLTLPGRRVYGRDGQVVFAELHGLAMTSLTPVARGELEAFGMLLRVPFCFADEEAFELVARESAGTAERPALAYVFTPSGALRARAPEARFRLVCAADSGRPLELRYRFVPGRSRLVRFDDWRKVGDVAVPFRRQFVDAQGRVSLVVDVAAIETGEPVLDVQFRTGR